MQIIEHIPNWAEGFEPREDHFDNLDELMELDWVKKWSEPVPTQVWTDVLSGEEKVIESQGKEFHRFSQSPHGSRYLLMVEFNEGTEWWVVGYLSEAVEGLPEWKPVEKDK